VRLASSLLAGLAAALLLPAPASASTSDDMRVGDVCLGGLIAFPDCPTTVHLDLGIAWQRSFSADDWQTYARGFAEAGLLFESERRSGLHLGPVVEIGFDLGEIMTGWHLTPKLMGRLWLADFVTLEGALGGTLARTELRDPGVAVQVRVGAYASFAFTLHAVFGVFAATEQLFDPEGHVGRDHRFILGLRGSIGFWGSIAYVLSGGK
jgi:hypothetical protein